ncbi:hypothetical protein BD560DRAFT_424061 [Blakeslea trispora]|nr:hypothetical protein BD560DRAFT_424061 [Blakeslea trispora]
MKREFGKLASHTTSDWRHTIDVSFNHELGAHKINPRVQYMRDTYYTSPRGTKSKIPHHLFGPPSPLNMTSTMTTPAAHDKTSEVNDIVHYQGYNLYGYIQTLNDKHYNKQARKITDENPMQ